MAGKYLFDVKFMVGTKPTWSENHSSVRADDSAEAERIVRKKHTSRPVTILDVKKRG